MAKLTFTGLKQYGDALHQLYVAISDDDMLLDAVWAGAQPVADAVRRQLEMMPVGELKQSESGWSYQTGPSQEAKDAMLDELGIAPPRMPNPGEADVKVGFDGFYGPRTRRHPRGYPVKYEAFVWEHGTSFSQKHPFVRPAVRLSRKEAIAEMDKYVSEALKKNFGK